MQDLSAREQLGVPEGFVEFPPSVCEQSIAQRFEEQAASFPRLAAIRLPDRDISYRELNDAADRAACWLSENISETPTPIALLLDQGYENIVWTLGILKTGHCYAPLDPRLPKEISQSLVVDLAPAGVIVAPGYRQFARDCVAGDAPVIDAESTLTAAATTFSSNLGRTIGPDVTACVFYTSGSTGRPKGVVDCHRNVLHNVMRYTNSLRFAPGDVFSLVQGPHFSGTVSTMFGALLNGATLAPFNLVDEGLANLSEWLRRSHVTVFHGVPSIFRAVSDPTDKFSDIRLVRLEGDRATPLDVQHFKANFSDGCVLVNGLGATECGLVRQFFIGKETSCAQLDAIPIGYSVPDMTVRVVDREGISVAPGVKGEIVVESKYLATGYWKNPDLTVQRFEELANGVRRYRTGDLGSMDEDGCLAHLGRTDHLTRINGEFVAVADIEKVLLAVPGVAQAAVRDYFDRLGERRLCAYIVTDSKLPITVSALRADLSNQLSESQMPSVFRFLDALPLSKDLKVDYYRLPAPSHARPDLFNAYIRPSTGVEQRMARLWSEVLEIEEVGVTDSFFDLGGDSLRAARLVNRIGSELDIIVTAAELFERRTIRSLLGESEKRQTVQDRPDADAPMINAEKSSNHSIAIVGMAGRFPGAGNLEEFWQNLRCGRESITKTGNDRDDASNGLAGGRLSAHGMLADADKFDAKFFRLTPREAEMLDPQQRIWLECVHRALEDAAVPLDDRGFAGDDSKVGVFVGGRESTYLWHLLGGDESAIQAVLQHATAEAHQLIMRNDSDSIATRTSFLFGFTGPSINVQTACSTSLVAVAQACDALTGRRCNMAVAGGVAVTFPQVHSYEYQEGGIFSRDGHCRAFDAEASGTVFGDGAGVVVLKRLEDALAGDDIVYAVIRGWTVNNDGSDKASFAAPSAKGQERVIVQAQRHAGVQAAEISYVEAHGTGTPVGDPIEFTALERAFRRHTDRRGFCALGSVKTNIGHLDNAAGIAGLIKAVLALGHREIPATLHFKQANPAIDLAASPFYINAQLQPWMTDGTRIAGVSSFGVGGTNCHIILEEAPPRQLSTEPVHLAPALLPISAASEQALSELEQSFRELFLTSDPREVHAIVATAQRSRSFYSHRTAMLAESAQEFASKLSSAAADVHEFRRWRSRASHTDVPRVGFVFSGQGAQYAGMGRELYRCNEEFRGILDDCQRILRGKLEIPLLDAMFGATADPELIHRTDYTQPALFALQYALAKILQSWGIKPEVVIGHSIGEIVAATLAGVFSLEDGLRFAAKCGRLMQSLSGEGRMCALSAQPEEVRRLLVPFGDEISIAAINGPMQVVLAGSAAAIERLGPVLQNRGVYHKVLAVSRGFHSAQMDGLLVPLADALTGVDLLEPSIPIVSNLYGRMADKELATKAYWCDHARQPVLFEAGVRAALEEGCNGFIEIGPNTMLATVLEEIASPGNCEVIPTLRRSANDWEALLETVARLYCFGADIDWKAIYPGRRSRPVHLPHYPLQRTRFWYQGGLAVDHVRIHADLPEQNGHPLIGRRLNLPGSEEIRFEACFSQTSPHYLTDHRLFGVSLPPAASHLAMLAQVAESLPPSAMDNAPVTRFEDLYMLRPLLLPDNSRRLVQLIFRPASAGWNIELASAPAQETALDQSLWTAHVIGVARSHRSEQRQEAEGLDLASIQARCPALLSKDEFYTKIWANQGGTGSAFRWIDQIWRGDREALASASCPGHCDATGYRLHPGLIEAACQVLHCCATIETREAMERNDVTFVPFSVDAFELYDAAINYTIVWCHAVLRSHANDDVVADLSILNQAGKLVACIEGFRLRPITRKTIAETLDAPSAVPSSSAPLTRPGIRRESSHSLADVNDLTDYIQAKCVEISGHPVAEISTDASFISLGFDSLVAMVLANHLRRDFGCSVAVTRILQSKSLRHLAQEIAQQNGESLFRM